MQDIRTILRLTHEQGLSAREVAVRLRLSKTTVATYLNRAREAGLNCWPLPAGPGDDVTLQRVLFQRVGRPSRDLTEPDWPKMVAEMKRKGVTLLLLWEEYRAAHPDGYGYTWFCTRYREFETRIPKLVDKLARVQLLILDDWGTHGLTDQQRLDLLELFEERYQRRSTIITAQLPVSGWHDMIG